MSELLLRGYNPAKSYLENGADIILSDGITIEVKCAHKLSRENGYNYNVKCGHSGSRKTLVNCDFLICWCIDDKDFFVIPFSEVAGKTGIALPNKRRKSKYEHFRNSWGLLNPNKEKEV